MKKFYSKIKSYICTTQVIEKDYEKTSKVMETIEGNIEADNREQILNLHKGISEVLSQMQNLVNSSYDLFKLNVKDSLTVEFEQYLTEGPVDNYNKVSKNISGHIKNWLHKLFIAFVSEKKDIVNKVYHKIDTGDEVFYCIVLKEDTTENRDSIFDFYDIYEHPELVSRYPVFFKFISNPVDSKLDNFELIKID